MPERTNLGFKTKTNGEKKKKQMSPTTPTTMLLRLDPIRPFPCSNDFLVSNTLLLVFELKGLTYEPFQKTQCLRSVVHQTLSSSSPPSPPSCVLQGIPIMMSSPLECWFVQSNLGLPLILHLGMSPGRGPKWGRIPSLSSALHIFFSNQIK
jgi:hypothetical protein